MESSPLCWPIQAPHGHSVHGLTALSLTWPGLEKRLADNHKTNPPVHLAVENTLHGGQSSHLCLQSLWGRIQRIFTIYLQKHYRGFPQKDAASSSVNELWVCEHI